MVNVKELQEKLQEISKMPKEKQAKASEMLSEEEIEFLQKQQGGSEEKMQCVFCKIAKGEIPTKKVYEDDFVMAFLDANPANPGHLLVIPKEHYEVLPQVPPDQAALLINTVRILAGAVFESVGAQGVNVLQNNGAVAGQAVPHVHFHVIPRFETDKFKFEWKPIKLEEKQLEEIQKRIIASAKSKAEKKKVVYDMSGKEIEETQAEQSSAVPSKTKSFAREKEKLMRIKSKIP